MGDKLPIFWALFDATTDLPYLKKMLPENVLAIFDNESDVKAVKLSNSGTDYKAVYITSCAKYDALRAENAEIVGLMRNIHRALPTTRCADLHHSKADRHAYNEVCKPLERYMAAQAAIDAALAKHRGE